MSRYLVIFQSHVEGPSDIHFVETHALSPLGAIANANRETPPMHPWVLVRAWPWPKGCADIEEAAEKMTGTHR